MVIKCIVIEIENRLCRGKLRSTLSFSMYAVAFSFFPFLSFLFCIVSLGAHIGRGPVMGPAMPPPELLAAAAQIPWEEEEDMEDIVGPPPPEMAEQLDGVGGDERISEVLRIIR